jgi:hypothetical protein
VVVNYHLIGIESLFLNTKIFRKMDHDGLFTTKLKFLISLNAHKSVNIIKFVVHILPQ